MKPNDTISVTIDGGERAYIKPLLYGRMLAARILGVSVRTIDYAITAKKLEIRRINQRKLITRESLEKFVSTDQNF